MSRRYSYPIRAMKGERRSLISDRIHGRCRFLGRNQRVSRRSNKRKERSLIKDRIHVKNFRVHLSAGFTSSNKVSVSPRSDHREWLAQCKNFYYYYEKKAK
jgi:hypothetical protein